MKRILFLFPLFLVGSFWLVHSPIQAAQNTPAPKPASHSAAAQTPLKRQIHEKIRTQMKDIRLALKSGKLTNAQAKTLNLSLFNTRKQELVFLRQNGGGDLTTDQQNQLNQTLDKNSSSIGETQAH